MKKMSLQWRLTCIITIYIAVICGCLTMLVYKNGVYYIDSLKETVDARGDETADDADEIYISIPEDNWDEFANDFSVQVYNNKTDYRKNSLIISAVLALLGGVATYFISGHALRPIHAFSDKIEEVQAQNLADSKLEENKVKELNQLSVSYNKMLGQLQDAGNTTTLAHYLDLLSKAGMLTGLPRFSDKETDRRKSSPRFMVYDTSLMTAISDKGRERLIGEPDLRGRLVESSVGARLIARGADEGFDVMWWRDGNEEVDFVLRKGTVLVAIEVKSGHESGQSGMASFLQKNPQARRIIVGGASQGACTVEEFLLDEVPLFGRA